MSQLLEWACPDCGKVISSLSKTQFDHNVSQHKDKHRRDKR